MKISSLIIAKNEEANIARCIESQLSCIDDILIILDDSTTDLTESIIQNYPTVRYEKVAWKGYSQTKSYGLTLIETDWVLWLDADEELTLKLQSIIMNFKKEEPEFIAYSVPRKAFFLGKWIRYSGWYPGRVIRLFNKNHAFFNGNDVHEGLNVKGDIGKLNADINHYTDPSIEHYYDKFNRYTSLAAKDADRKNINISLFDMLFRPLLVFSKMYFLRLGFLDGLHGLILAVFSANYVFTKYTKIWELSRKK